MKAAILKALGDTPVYQEIETPEIKNEDQLLIGVKASPLKNFDQLRTSKTFYASYKELPAVIGSDGVGLLPNGTVVYAISSIGTFAEKTIINRNRYVVLPAGLDYATAAALPNAILGSTVALKLRGFIRKGDSVLINGATGFTGQVAVQVARYLQAGRIIASGRNEQRLEHLRELGATHLIRLGQSEEKIIGEIDALQREVPIDIVLDYLWGISAEMLLDVLSKGPTHSVRFINLGNDAGQRISIDANTIRSSAVEIIGSGGGSYTGVEMDFIFNNIFPEMYQLAAKGLLKVNTERFDLADIEKVWNQRPEAGKRLVAMI